MERLVPNQMTGKPDKTYLAGLRNVVHDITTKGGHAIIDPHNFGRYYGNIITNPASFQAFWHTVASEFAGNPNVVRFCFFTNEAYSLMLQDF
jgi:endoglucanase